MAMSDLDCSCKRIHQGNIGGMREPWEETYHLRMQSEDAMGGWKGRNFCQSPRSFGFLLAGHSGLG